MLCLYVIVKVLPILNLLKGNKKENVVYRDIFKNIKAFNILFRMSLHKIYLRGINENNCNIF